MDCLARYFDAAFLINLPERTDRLKLVGKEFSRVGWNIGPQEIRLFPGSKFSEPAGFPSAGVRGAFHSHWNCLSRAASENRRNVLILEDDIAFSSALARLTPSIVSRLEAEDWDFVFFGHYKTGAIPNANSKTLQDNLRFQSWTSEIQGLHFYGVSGRILGALISHLEKVANGVEGDQEMGPMPVDGALNVFRRMNPDVRTLIVNPKLGWQSSSRSDIMPGALDQFRVLRPLTAALRNIKHVMRAWRS